MGTCLSGDAEPAMNVRAVDQTHFRMLKVVGRGGFGKVNAVQHRITSNLYAMKRLKKSKLVSRSQYVSLAWRERDVMSRIKSPFLVNLLYAFQDRVHLYLIMPFMQGGDLRYYLNTRGCMREADAAFYAAEIILGLEELHRLNVVYRDLKPDNILLDDTGHVRISDFGLAVFLKRAKNYQVTGGAGTAGYQAPEVLLRQPYGRAVDVWSLGVTMYELIEGVKPFRSAEDACRESRIEFHQKLKPETKELIRGMLVRDPARRLGCGTNGWNDIKKHAFFQRTDWAAIGRRELKVPFQPDLERAHCPADFELEDQFFEEKKEPPLTPEQQAKFVGFEFNTAYGTSPSALLQSMLLSSSPPASDGLTASGLTNSGGPSSVEDAKSKSSAAAAAAAATTAAPSPVLANRSSTAAATTRVGSGAEFKRTSLPRDADYDDEPAANFAGGATPNAAASAAAAAALIQAAAATIVAAPLPHHYTQHPRQYEQQTMIIAMQQQQQQQQRPMPPLASAPPLAALAPAPASAAAAAGIELIAAARPVSSPATGRGDGDGSSVENSHSSVQASSSSSFFATDPSGIVLQPATGFLPGSVSGLTVATTTTAPVSPFSKTH